MVCTLDRAHGRRFRRKRQKPPYRKWQVTRRWSQLPSRCMAGSAGDRGGAAGRGHGAADPNPNGERCCLFEDSGEAGKHVVHDGIGDGFDPPSPSGTEIKHAWLVTADHAGRSGSYALERNREPTPAREAPASGDRQDDRHPGQLVESVRGNDQYRSSALLFMTSRGVETDKPDVAALHYNSSLPAGLAWIQSRSSEERAAGSSHCARSSSSE